VAAVQETYHFNVALAASQKRRAAARQGTEKKKLQTCAIADSLPAPERSPRTMGELARQALNRLVVQNFVDELGTMNRACSAAVKPPADRTTAMQSVVKS